MNLESKFVWMNGALVPHEQATVPFLTPALHYGTAVFEGMRAYNTPRGPAIFRLKDHIGQEDFPYRAERHIHLAPAQVLVIDFDSQKSEFVFM